MARFLRFIVDLFLVCAILIAAAILVPPLFGVDMTMIDSTRIKTNMPMGSVAYSRVVDASELLVGDEIIESDSSSVYSYVIKEKSGDGTFTLAASSDDNSAVETRDLTGKVKKVAVAVPYIGYVSVAMQNLEGQIVLGLMVVLVIILFILSELWRPDEDDDSDEEEDEDEEEGKTAVLDAAEDELAAAVDGEAVRQMMPDVEVVIGDASPEENEGAGDTKEPEVTPVTAEDANVAETKIMKTQKDLEEAIRAYEEKYINSPAGQAEESIAPDPAEEITEPDGEEENVASQSAEEIVVSPAEEDMMLSGEEETVIASSGKEETVSPETYDTISDAEEDDEDDDDDLIIPEEELTIEGPWIGVEEENDTDTAPEDTDGNAGDTVILEPVKTSEENEAPDVTEIKDEFGDLEEALTRQLQSETEKDRPSADNDEIWKINEKDGFITDAPDGEETDAPDEGPQEFLPVERMTLDDLYEQVKKEKQRPTIERDDATGITVFDYTELV